MSWNINQNPYNFVRFSERIVEKGANGEALELPDHSVFSSSGNSGYIECELTNETPLFCGGEIKDKNADHKKIEFFKLNGKLAIPSTSLKGMIRAFIETLTGSCMSIFDRDVLSYREMLRPSEMKCGMITTLAGRGAPGQIGEMQKMRVPISEVRSFKNGDTVSFNISGTPQTAHIDSNGSHTGILKKNEKNIGLKNHERIYYNPAKQHFGFSQDEQTKYNRIVNTHIANWKRMNKPSGVTETNFHRLSIGDLVIFQASGGNAFNLAYIEVPRLSYNNSRGYFLEKDIPENYCTESQRCLACRLFGYVDQKTKTNYSGRISISHGVISGDSTTSYTTIKPLGEPNPTSVNLYLVDEKDRTTVRDYNNAKIERHGESFASSRTDIGGDVHLRGRKFYWHKKEKDVLENAKEEEKVKVNSTIEALEAKAKFFFKVHFHNLTDFELGLLLYALKLEGSMRHKLGMAKSLGFGTVKIDIQNLSIDDMTKKYSSLNLDYRKKKTPEEIDKYIKEEFQTKIANFDDLVAVQDLRRILDPARAPESLGYPEESDGKNYKWYMENKNKPLPLLLNQGKEVKSA
ncbi:TIGR03986 family CRISPR-associated RAMP protein [bacterium]|nr:TIGR03986 family CRISPR-associated RAMP protein [bacterium]MBU1614288.1 TIGR03986 family CRISPR-associated RAMP protein [bacterium]